MLRGRDRILPRAKTSSKKIPLPLLTFVWPLTSDFQPAPMLRLGRPTSVLFSFYFLLPTFYFQLALVKFLLLPLLLAPTFLFADGLSDVRATLQKLQSDQPLRARVEIKTRHSGGESSKQKQSESVYSVIVES